MYDQRTSVRHCFPGRQAPLFVVSDTGESWKASSGGVECSDCVNSRRGTEGNGLFLHTVGGRVNIRNAVHTDDLRPIDEECPCYGAGTSPRAYIRTWCVKGNTCVAIGFNCNLTFYFWLVRPAREAILGGSVRCLEAGLLRQSLPILQRPLCNLQSYTGGEMLSFVIVPCSNVTPRVTEVSGGGGLIRTVIMFGRSCADLLFQMILRPQQKAQKERDKC